MKKELISIIIIQFMICQLSFAQNGNCGTDDLHKTMMLNDSNYNRQLTNLNRKVSLITKNNKEGLEKSGTTYIPIVVHVIHLGEPAGTGTNISDEQIHEAIIGLNDHYNNTNGYGVDMNIEFCLAIIDPNMQSTSGINRVDGSSLVNYQTNGISMIYNNCDAASEDSVKDLSRWPVSDYYNIWVVNKICKGTSGIQGVAYLPYGGENDGVVIISSRMIRNASTLAHEIGHGFNLHHTFKGCCDGTNIICPENNDCTAQGDQICDTPPHKQKDCGSTNPCTSTGNWDNSRYNIMSYCLQKDRFTLDQKDRIMATLSLYPRQSLVSSAKCASHTGLEQFTKNLPISISPNPSQGNYKMKMDDDGSNFTIKIYNSIGALINTYETNNSVFDFSITNPNGIYLIQVSSDTKHSEVLKVVKHN